MLILKVLTMERLRRFPCLFEIIYDTIPEQIAAMTVEPNMIFVSNIIYLLYLLNQLSSSSIEHILDSSCKLS